MRTFFVDASSFQDKDKTALSNSNLTSSMSILISK